MPMNRPGRLPATLAIVLVAACGERPPTEPAASTATSAAEPSFVGTAACADCHAAEHSAWRNSHHDLAMDHATEATVLGDFDDAALDYFGTVSRFFRRGDGFRVLTDGPSGAPEEYEVLYTFGVTPLQQYLVALPGGRLQALPIAWDTRSEAEGGQRWFHLYPDERIDHEDVLHWTGQSLNWNYMCAECHSTDLNKNYDAASRTYRTTWAEIDVGCEGCHGPGSRHVERARQGVLADETGLLVDLDDRGGAVWRMNADTGIAERSVPVTERLRQPDACGRCHARRSPIVADYEFGRPLLDTHRPALLEEGLYFADGQIDDEVYVWGSFLQSRMHGAGVSCTDCHEPHSATLRTGAVPSDICATCHLPARFAAESHHHHPDRAVACVDCHMASRDYMVIDGRRDHSFRVPRPDLTLATGAPNACRNCHRDRPAEWAREAVERWYGGAPDAHYGTALAAGRSRAPGANRLLADAAGDPRLPAIARATAVSLIAPPLGARETEVLRAAIAAAEPLLRLGAARALAAAPVDARVVLGMPLLDDAVRAVRIEAFSALSPVRDRMPQARLRRAEEEYVAAQLAAADRPEAHANLAAVFVDRGETERAEAAYRLALDMQPRAAAARTNLADLYRAVGRDGDGRTLLEEGLDLTPESAALHHALGLLEVRQEEPEQALASLGRAVELDPGNARYAYVHGVALNSFGRPREAIDALASALERFPGDVDIAWALATMLRDAGRQTDALAVAESLRSRYPDSPEIAALVDALRAR